MDWKNQIAGCFGNVDQIFAGHPLDEERAFKLLTVLRKERIGWSLVEPAFREHLQHKNCGEEHIATQIARVEKHMKPWLDD
jgi:hypothetical protein